MIVAKQAHDEIQNAERDIEIDAKMSIME